MFIALTAILTWAIVATVALVVLVGQRSEALKFPQLSTPISSEEQKALDDLKQANEEVKDLRIRLKHAEQERDRAVRDERMWRLRGWRWERKERELRRVLDRDDGSDVPAPADADTVELETVGRAG